MKGKLFNIQRYSIQDGPGIRTTVFLKGCPLRCRWCSNPESWAVVPELFYTKSKCIGCLCCMHTAKGREISQEGGLPVIRRDLCTPEKALELEKACPTGALSVKYMEMEPDELLREIKKDSSFYETSGGGVTFSGGEPLLQKEFIKEILELCRAEGIRTAIETTGCVPFEVFREISDYVDLYLYDMKHPDSDMHKKYTGVGNEQILENLERLKELGADIHVRVPVIPGFNDQADTLKKIGEMLNRLGISKRTLLPFHQYGSSKYKALGIAYSMEEAAQMDETTLKNLAEVSGFYEEK